ncbi:MAG TPA: response regulator transcription factor [Nocardioides sp.]|nr:response regulator transcription factor [Nocardioides sp.]HSX66165.1 response regulator transcription factor [Nocardioides sp.]
MTARLLVMEDDDDVAAPLLRALAREGHEVSRVALGADGLARVAEGGIDLVLLDLGLPDIDGLEVCRQLRDNGYEGGVLMLTARASELDRVDGLDVGADDYLAKPFGLAELQARTRALLRRTARLAAGTTAAGGGSAGGVGAGGAGDGAGVAGAGVNGVTGGPDDLPVVHGVRVDRSARRAWAGTTELALTEKEFDLLAELWTSRGTVLTREALMDAVWDENWFGSTKTLDVTMGRLRQKLEDAGVPGLITTVRGVGFRFDGTP